MTSKKYTLNKVDGTKILTGLSIALIGAIATFLMDTIPQVEFGAYTPLVLVINSTIVNLLRKFAAGK